MKIELGETTPKIWRRFVVPADIPLDYLHDVIQIVMGWEDCHLHEFTIDGKRYAEPFEECYEGEEPPEDEGLYRLGLLVKRTGDKFEYLYDFGDGWEHTLVLEKANFKPGTDDEPVRCLDGRGACPPEDVGGLPGYYEFVEAVRDPSHEEHEEYATWFGKPFDPEAVKVGEVNLNLLRYMRWVRPRRIPWDPRDGLVG